MRRIPTLAAVLAAALAVAGCGGAAGLGEGQAVPPPPPEKREVAAAFDVPALDGSGRVRLAEHRGRPVVVNFWASWCGPCRSETPELVRFAGAHPGVEVIGLAVNDLPADSRRFAKEYGIPYRLGIDRRGGVGADYGIIGLPVTVVIDAQGRLVANHAGEIDAAELESLTAPLGG